jgi:iron complex transport system substrate-binding protein
VNREYQIIKLFNVLLMAILLYGCTAEHKAAEGMKYRIISLSPHITEILYKLHAEKNLVAVTDFCSFPREAQKLEKIGGLLNPNIEKIVALKPTHVFGVPAHADLAAALAQFSIEIIMLPNETISDYLSTVLKIGQTIGRDSMAHDIVNNFTDSLRGFSNPAIKDTPSGVLVIGRENGSLRNITVAGPATFISELWEKVGGRNIYDDLTAHYSGISIESLLMRNPDIIIELSSREPAKISQLRSGTAWHDLNTIHAVQLNHIFKISGSYTVIPGPRMLKLARDFSEIIKEFHNEKRIYSDLHRQR